MAKILQFSVDKVSLMVCVSWWISSEEEAEEILLENVLWNPEATIGHRAEPRQLEEL